MNPRMITLAREARGLSQSRLAKLVGMSQGALSKAENGIAPLPPERLAVLAEALGFPREVLDWTDEHVGLGSSGFYHRKQSGLGTLALQQIEADINLLLMRLRRLESSVEVEPPFGVPVLDVDMSSPEDIAARVRAAWLMPDGPVHDAIRTVERAGIVVIRRDLGSPKISGLSIRPPASMPVIVLNQGQPADRERFTVFHELGHLVMHQVPSEDGEREADRFASEILMPTRLIAPYLAGMSIQKAIQLKQHWKTSMESIIRKAHDTGRIDAGRYKSLRVQMNQHHFTRSEPAEPPREEPQILPDMLVVHREEHGYSDAELASVVGLRAREFHTEYGAVSRSLRAV